jgi:hypothetical protein
MQRLEAVINLLDEATTLIYNMEGDLYHDVYEKLEAIVDLLKKAEA